GVMATDWHTGCGAAPAIPSGLRNDPRRDVRHRRQDLWRPYLRDRQPRSLDTGRAAAHARYPQIHSGRMIRAVDVSKEYRTEGRTHRALDGVSFSLAKGEKLALLGHNGAGKSTLIRLLGRVELPTSGKIEQTMSSSWPLGLTGGFQGTLTGNDNI